MSSSKRRVSHQLSVQIRKLELILQLKNAKGEAYDSDIQNVLNHAKQVRGKSVSRKKVPRIFSMADRLTEANRNMKKLIAVRYIALFGILVA